MARFIKAVEGMNHSVIYTDDTGNHFRFFGGTWAWRNHNPANVWPGRISKRHNQTKEGNIVEVFQVTKTRINLNGVIISYCIGDDWISKEQCLDLAEKGWVDLTICVSQLGNMYLRAPQNSLFQEKLDSIIDRQQKGKNK